MLVVLLLLMGAVAWAGLREPPRGPVQRPWLTALGGAGAVVLVAVALALAGAGPSTGTPAAGANPARFASAQSNRYAYWHVALDAFAAHPLKGVGSGGFRVEWRREREVLDPARDAHSLYLETAAELGLVGLLLLGTAIPAGWSRRCGRGGATRPPRPGRSRRSGSTRCTPASTGTGRCPRSRSSRWRSRQPLPVDRNRRAERPRPRGGSARAVTGSSRRAGAPSSAQQRPRLVFSGSRATTERRRGSARCGCFA